MLLLLSRHYFLVIALFASVFLCLGAGPAVAAQKAGNSPAENFHENSFPEGKTVRVGVSHNPPLGIHGKGKPPQGFVIDIIRDVARAEKWNLVFIEKPWPQLLKLLDTGGIDLLGGIAYTPERAEKYSFTQEAAANNWAVVYRNRNVMIDSIADLEGKKISVIPRGVHTLALDQLAKSFGLSFTQVPADDYAKTLELVDSGAADAGIVARTFHILHGLEYRALATTIRFNPIEIRFASPKGHGQSLLSALDRYLSTQKNDPTSRYSELLELWFTGAAKSVVPVWAYWVIGSIFTLLVVTWLTVIWLRYKIGSRTRDLRESEKQFRDIINNLPDTFYRTDAKGIIVMVSPSCQQLTGYTQDEMIAQPIEQFYIDANQHRKIAQRIIEAKGQAVVVESELVHSDGSLISVSTKVYARFDDEGNFIGTEGIAQDITERKKLEDQLRQAHRMEAVGQLTGGVAHDFNNLLSVLLGNTEMLDDHIGRNEAAKRNIEALKNAINRAASLTSRLLAFSRQQTLSPTSTDITVLVNGLEEMLRRTLGETVDLQVIGGQNLWLATIDQHQFENALINLAINARDAMPDGGTLTIETANVILDKTYTDLHADVEPGDYVRVTVSDSGTGMPSEIIDRVFEPFFTTKEVGAGSGLGLSMVYGFIRQSGGYITLNSEVSHGTIITLYMPCSEGALEQTITETDSPRFEQGMGRILIVEDDESVREVPATILRNQGYDIVEAGNGAEAIKHLEDAQRFDLLFTDIVLPGGISGIDIAAQAVELQPDIKILYTTGYTENSVNSGSYKGKLDSDMIMVSKPYSRDELLEKVCAILDVQDC